MAAPGPQDVEVYFAISVSGVDRDDWARNIEGRVPLTYTIREALQALLTRHACYCFSAHACMLLINECMDQVETRWEVWANGMMNSTSPCTRLNAIQQRTFYINIEEVPPVAILEPQEPEEA